MRKFLFASVYLLLVLWSVPALAAPDLGIGPNSDDNIARSIADTAGYSTDNISDTTFSESIGKVVKVVLSLVGMIFLVLTIYAGILWMTASGNEEQVTSATNILKRAIIGMVIVVGAYGITVFVLAAVLTSTGVSHANLGGDVGQKGFWSSFGKKLKTDWYRIMFP